MSGVAIYPGSFDPVTNGHLDIVSRSRRMFDRVIVTIAKNPKKEPAFSIQDRVSMFEEAVSSMGNVFVEPFGGLLVDFARDREACAIVRGLRAVSDFEYEFQMALMNRKLNGDVETVFLMTGFQWIYTSSSIIKNVHKLGGDVSSMVPKNVLKYLARGY